MKTKLRRWLVSWSLVSLFGLFIWLPGTAFAATPAPQHPCQAHWVFDQVHGTGTNFRAATRVYGQTNPFKHKKITVTLTATTTRTVTFTSGDTTGVGLDFEFLQVKKDVNSSISRSISTTVGHAVAITLSPGQSVFGQYGVKREIAVGHLYMLNAACQVTNNHGWVTTYSPWYATWKLWR